MPARAKLLVLHWVVTSLGTVGQKGGVGTVGADLSSITVGKTGHTGIRKLGNAQAIFASAKI